MLCEGDHFGEIALLYPGCRRTCTVISRNYNTMAIIDQRNLRSLISEYPMYKELLIKSVFKYDDPKLQFLKKMINKLKYVEGLNQYALHEMMFTFKQQIFQGGDIILRTGDVCNELLFVENGIVEVFTEFEGNEFVIERLTQGAIINSRCFFMEDLMAVNIRCV